MSSIDHMFFFFLRVFRARSLGPGAPVGVLLAGGADDRSDVEVRGSSRETYLLPRPQLEQVPPPRTHTPHFHVRLNITCFYICFPFIYIV